MQLLKLSSLFVTMKMAAGVQVPLRLILSSMKMSLYFIITLVFVRMCLGYTKSATIQLQRTHIDIIRGFREISMMKMSLQTARVEIDVYQHQRCMQ